MQRPRRAQTKRSSKRQRENLKKIEQILADIEKRKKNGNRFVLCLIVFALIYIISVN